MELKAAAVSADLPDYRVAVLYSVLVHLAAHIAEECPRDDVLKADLHALLSDLNQPLLLLRYLSDAEHS